MMNGVVSPEVNMKVIVLTGLLLVSALAQAAEPSAPYAGQQNREIKALSSEQVADLLAGRGMGFAKSAELNGYPGPLHVLELATQLDLTPEQVASTQELHRSMQVKAAALGRKIVDAEALLDQSFADQSISNERLASALAELGQFQSELRRTHLEAHLEQTKIVSPSQIVRYSELRGYSSKAEHGAHGHHH
jgi:hypothetical protein